MTSWKRTIRVRLTMGFVAIVVVANTLVSAVTIWKISRVLIEEVQTRVRLNLNSAQSTYDGHTTRIGLFLRGASLDGTIERSIQTGQLAEVIPLLDRIRREGNMDMLALLGARGQVLARAGGGRPNGDSLSAVPIVARSLRSRRPAHGTVVVPHALLEREGEDLARRAHLVVRGASGEPASEPERRDGMAVGAAVPLSDGSGQLVGLLFGANLLSGRHDIVDEIKDRVFQNERYEGKDIGTATIFQGDLRVSTNVRTSEGSRAVGTRMSSAVFDRVIRDGQIWADRAFVVNDWYISAYGPIRDPDGRVIGSLYVGLLEAPFTRPRIMTALVFLGAMGVTSLLSLLLIFFVTKLILQPISEVIGMSTRIAQGDLSARVSIKPTGEMGLLCHAINQMADAVRDREEQLKSLTNRQIGQSEKLASIGRLAAGIAHEINNPLTGVLTFTHLLRKKAVDEQDRQDLDLVIRETTRVREIVRGLLDFARSSPPSKGPLELNEVIRQALRLVASQKEFKRVTIEEDLTEGLPLLYGDRNQLQQVILNISLNGCEAMHEGGTLRVATRKDGDRLITAISDTGHGIAADEVGRIFDPFFTTKPAGKGTGLGLSVSYGIIQAHGGSIEVDSVVGKGTTFRVVLPLGEPDPGTAGGGSGPA